MHRLLATGLLALLLCGPRTSHAAAFEIDARTEAQAYQLRSYQQSDPANPVLLPRRRIVQYLSFNAFELVTGEDFGFESSLRLFADMGLPNGEASMLDGVRAQGMDLLYANATYRHGGFEAQLGRQTYVDVMDYMAFDGLRVRYMNPIGVGAEAYGGLWVKGASLFGSSVYQPDGTRETDARRIALGALPTNASLSAVEPLVGAKLLFDLGGVSGSVGYRRAMVDGKIDLERLAADARFGRGRGLNILAGAEFDLFQSKLSQFRAQARYDAEDFAASLEGLQVTPVFSSDSIWYYFANGPRDEARLRFDWLPPGPFRFYVSLHEALYGLNLNSTSALSTAIRSPALPGGAALGTSENHGGSVGTAMRWEHFRAAADLTYRNGFGGRQLWADLTAGVFGDRERYTVDLRLSLASIADSLNPLLRGNFYGAQVWGGYKLTRATRVSVVLEENVNPFTRSDTKVFFVFDLKAAL